MRSRVGWAALWTWTLLGVAGLLFVGWLVFLRLEVVLAPMLLALFPTAALAPVVGWLAGRRLPRPLATLLVMLTVLGALVGLGMLIVPVFLAQLPELAQSLTQSGTQLDSLLSRLPFGQPGASVSELARRAALALSGGVTALLSAALSIGSGIVLVVALWAVYLSGGPRIVRTALGLVPSRHRSEARELGDRIWQTLGSYTRALTAVAIFDAIVVGMGLWFLGVPLVLPLAVLVFIGAYLPYVGAFASGLVAVLVGLAEGGLGRATAVLVLIIVVQMVDGNVIQPLVMGRVVAVTAVTVIVSVAIGATLLGVLGAFLAVPVAAIIGRTIAFVREQQAAGTQDRPSGGTG